MDRGPATEGSCASAAPSGPPPPPGESKSLKSHVLDAGTSLLQSFKPLKGIHQHVCAFHCYAHDPKRQVRAHHFCSHRNEEMRQCVIYDGDGDSARLIGVEYIISRRLFEALPAEEKKYWHSHVYEVTSGQLIAPGVPIFAQNEDAKKWHMWQVDQGHELPYGPAQLMMSFTADGQLDPALLEERDKMLGADTEKVRESRREMAASAPVPHPGADQTWHGRGWQCVMQQFDVE